MKFIEILKNPQFLDSEFPIPLTMEYYEYLKELDPEFYQHLMNRDPEQHTARTFSHIYVSRRLSLSVQASFMHNCIPKLSLPLEEYAAMELAFFSHLDMVPANKVVRDTKLLKRIERYRSRRGLIYSHVPVELIEEIYEYAAAYYEGK